MSIQEHLWADIVRAAPSSGRKGIRKSVLKAIEYFGAKFKKVSSRGEEPNYELKSKNVEAEWLAKWLKSNEVNFVGFAPSITYIKESGSDDELKYDWEHPFGNPALLYGHKKLPILIIAGPDIMVDDSILSRIPANEVKAKSLGIHG